MTELSFGTRITFGQGGTWLSKSAIGASGEMVFVGSMSGVIDFGLGPIATHGYDDNAPNDTDGFIVVVDPT